MNENIIVIKQDSTKEYMEIDIDNMELNRFYTIAYQNETRRIKKIDDNHIEFHGVE